MNSEEKYSEIEIKNLDPPQINELAKLLNRTITGDDLQKGALAVLQDSPLRIRIVGEKAFITWTTIQEVDSKSLAGFLKGLVS
jgi:sorbitol-specific phosphotransferase system component IIA